MGTPGIKKINKYSYNLIVHLPSVLGEITYVNHNYINRETCAYFQILTNFLPLRPDDYVRLPEMQVADVTVLDHGTVALAESLPEPKLDRVGGKLEQDDPGFVQISGRGEAAVDLTDPHASHHEFKTER